ncbi:hypothetical protein SD70_18060 [Gordoniibacillus kamchatkensis]|uniref:DUF1232 domain-containing protein n=1 Tax=Gordoniibacillus kamchatkensis TaxID=1590651 RepID=A0ABR5AFL0_9BACL|nr:hypothetical protein [Paenibacillus sp. VKM B-2647]KIL39797.1 hypothetical protein SD70_18060 [Paenibacillus sp. VKM B-2647]
MFKTVRWWSLRRWGRAVARVWRIIRSPQVPLRVKLLFVVPVLLYWVLPDALPGLPFDDIAVTLLLTGWFASYTERKYPHL